METPVPEPHLGYHALRLFQEQVRSGPPDPETLERLLAGLTREGRLEHAWLFLRQVRADPGLWGGVLVRLRTLAEQGRARRMTAWQSDPARRTLRLRFQARQPASAEHPAGLVALLARALLDADLPLAMGLEKSPRPMVHLGHPLPAGVEGLSEWADAALLEPPGAPVATLPDRVNAVAAPGLRVLECLQVPNHASPVAELCRLAHWSWRCPEPWLDAARERVAAFSAADRFEIEKPGKVAGQKGVKRMDIRPMLQDCRWEGDQLLFETPVAPGSAANPRKLLAAVLERELPAEGWSRTGLDLAEDPRLTEAGKFEPKLRNIFEDAVALESGPALRIVDEDDDEPIRLG
jgi:radical SAM-linked protein